MLLTRAEMTFDFGSARFSAQADRALLAWVMSQFLYGEVTGIQCGHWLYGAPDLEAARFFARQAVEEFQHVDNFLRILALLGEAPQPAHRLVRWLSSGMMPATFEEHVCLEMAIGEGWVLSALYGLIDTIDHPEIREILGRAVRQEERHVDFGEERTRAALAQRPRLRRRLLGHALTSTFAVRRLARGLGSRLPDHPVLQKLPAFLEFSVRSTETRLQRMGLCDRPLAALSGTEKAWALASAHGGGLLRALGRVPLRLLPQRRLTDTYLSDPAVRGASGQPLSSARPPASAPQAAPVRARPTDPAAEPGPTAPRH